MGKETGKSGIPQTHAITMWDFSWIERAIAVLREHTELPLTFSLVGLPRDENGKPLTGGFEFLDLWEPHLWMVHGNGGEFYKRVGYDYARRPVNSGHHAGKCFGSAPWILLALEAPMFL